MIRYATARYYSTRSIMDAIRGAAPCIRRSLLLIQPCRAVRGTAPPPPPRTPEGGKQTGNANLCGWLPTCFGAFRVRVFVSIRQLSHSCEILTERMRNG